MVDLRKVLEGVPGLIVMAACGLVGVAIGFSIALSTAYWVKASDGMANFWGGVVGAGLGAGLAVLGAFYVQKRDARDRLEATINLLASDTHTLQILLYALARLLANPQQSMKSRLGASDFRAVGLGRVEKARAL